MAPGAPKGSGSHKMAPGASRGSKLSPPYVKVITNRMVFGQLKISSIFWLPVVQVAKKVSGWFRGFRKLREAIKWPLGYSGLEIGSVICKSNHESNGFRQPRILLIFLLEGFVCSKFIVFRIEFGLIHFALSRRCGSHSLKSKHMYFAHSSPGAASPLPEPRNRSSLFTK